MEGQPPPSINERRLASVRAIRDEFFGDEDASAVDPRELLTELSVLQARISTLQIENQRLRDEVSSLRKRPEPDPPSEPKPDRVEPSFDFYRD